MFKFRLGSALLAGGLLCGGAASAQLPAQIKPAIADYSRGAKLELVARFSEQQITGVAVSPTGRIFVNLPRWTQDVPISVAEVVDGKLKAFPDKSWNAWRNSDHLDPGTHFVCVQSVVFDRQGHLWALDPASPGMEGPVKGGPKMVEFDIETGKALRTVMFDDQVAPAGSYLNDVRFSPDGHFAYLTDSGVKGALVVVDLRDGKARRVLDGDKSTQPDPKVAVQVDGHVLRRPDGRQPQFAADGIALSADGETLYWQALTGKTLYRIGTNILEDATARDVASKVETVATTHVADGLWIDGANTLYISDPEHDAVDSGQPNGSFKRLATDKGLRWPDSFAEGSDGVVYITSSHIQDSPWFKPEAKTTPSEIWKIVPAEAP